MADHKRSGSLTSEHKILIGFIGAVMVTMIIGFERKWNMELFAAIVGLQGLSALIALYIGGRKGLKLSNSMTERCKIENNNDQPPPA